MPTVGNPLWYRLPYDSFVEVPNRICIDLGQNYRKSSEFFGQMLLNQLLREDLTLVMADVADADSAVGVEKLVVFIVGCNEYISSGPNGIRQQKAANAPANGYAADGVVGQVGVTDQVQNHFFF